MTNVQKIIRNFLRAFDVFGAGINFMIDKAPLFKTVYGGIISIMFIGFATYYCISNLILFASRTQMSIIYNQKVVSPNPEIKFNETQFNIGFSFKYDNNSEIDPLLWNYFEEKAYICTYYNSSKKVKVPLPLRNCEPKDFYNLLNEERMTLMGIPELMCIEGAEELNIQGAFSDEIYRYIEYGIYIKEAVLQSQALMSQVEELFKKSQFKVTYSFIDGAVDVNNQLIPQKRFITNYYFQADVGLIQKVDIGFSIQQFQSDENILFEDYSPENSQVIYDDWIQHFSSSSNRTEMAIDFRNILVKLYIRASSNMFVYKRQYYKLTNFLADMTGLLGQILFLIYFGANNFNQFEVHKKIMNHVLKYKEHLGTSQNKEFEVLKKKVFNSKILIEKDNKISEGGDNVLVTEENNNNNFHHVLTSENNHTRSWNQIIPNEKLSARRTVIDQRIKIFSQLDKNRKAELPTPVNQEKEEDHTILITIPNHEKKISIVSEDIQKGKEEDKKINEKNVNNNLIVPDDNANRYLRFLQMEKSKRKSIKEEDVKPIFDTKLSKPITISIFEKLLSYICCKTRKLELQKRILDKSMTKFQYYLDIHTYIKKMQEIDIIKYLFLNTSQLILFNFISKPSVSLSNNKSDALFHSEIEKTNYVGYKLKLNEIDELIKSYEALTVDENDGNNEINQKIVTLFNNEILNLMS